MVDFKPESEAVEQTFQRLAGEGLELRANVFTDCRFVRCVFTEAAFNGCRFTNCAFEYSDLSLLKVPGTVFSGASFSDSKLVGVNWTEAAWPLAQLGPPLQFEKCNLSHSSFLGLKLVGVKIRQSQAVGVDFREADLAEVDFSGTDLDQSLFLHTDLRDADFRTARNYHIVPGENVLTGARFALPEALSLLYNLEIILDDTGPIA